MLTRITANPAKIDVRRDHGPAHNCYDSQTSREINGISSFINTYPFLIRHRGLILYQRSAEVLGIVITGGVEEVKRPFLPFMDILCTSRQGT